MADARVRLDRIVSIVEISGIERILDVSFLASRSPVGGGVRYQFLANSVALSGMTRRASIFDSKDESLVPAWEYARDTQVCLAAILGMPWAEFVRNMKSRKENVSPAKEPLV